MWGDSLLIPDVRLLYDNGDHLFQIQKLGNAIEEIQRGWKSLIEIETAQEKPEEWFQHSGHHVTAGNTPPFVDYVSCLPPILWPQRRSGFVLSSVSPAGDCYLLKSSRLASVLSAYIQVFAKFRLWPDFKMKQGSPVKPDSQGSLYLLLFLPG